MNQDSLSYKIFKNASYTFLNYSIPILFSIFITPVVVRRLGVEDFGVYVLVNTIVGFLGLLDLGLTTALVKFISEYFARHDFVRLQKLINSANTLFLFIGLLSFLAFVFVGLFFLPVFNIGSGGLRHILIVFLLAGGLNFLNAINSIYTIAPAALQRFDITTKASLGQLTVQNLLILVAVLLGYKLKVILLINLVTSFGLTLYMRWHFHKLLPQIRLGFSIDKTEVKIAYKFGFLAAISNVANGFLNQLDRLIIPMFLGPAPLTYYSLPGNVAQKTSGVVGSISGVLFPLTSSMASLGETDKIKEIYRKTLRNMTLVAAACSLAIAVFARNILEVWLGREFAERGTTILVILAGTYFLLALFNALTNFLMGLNKMKFLAAVSVGMAMINLVLLLVLLPALGIIGAAWAYLGAALVIPFIFWWTEERFLRLGGTANFYIKLYSKIILTSVIFFALMHYLVVPWANSLFSLVIVGPLAVVFYFVLYKVFGFIEPEDWAVLLDFLNKIKLRFKFSR